jgi:hypothetical protein
MTPFGEIVKALDKLDAIRRKKENNEFPTEELPQKIQEIVRLTNDELNFPLFLQP